MLPEQPHSWKELIEQLKDSGNTSYRLLRGESPQDEILWQEPSNNSSHVGALAWKRNDNQPTGTRNPIGTLLVLYISGGSKNTGTAAPIVYAYDEEPYSVFYYMMNRTPSAGRYTYYTLIPRNRGRIVANV